MKISLAEIVVLVVVTGFLCGAGIYKYQRHYQPYSTSVQYERSAQDTR